MYIATNTLASSAEGIIEFMPHALRKFIYSADISDVYEIHLCIGRPVIFYDSGGYFFVSRSGEKTNEAYAAVRTTPAHISEAMELASRSSVYSVEDEIRNGFITIDGGHRIGICGSAVIKNGKIAFVKDVSALNYRIAREIKGAADPVIGDIYIDGEVKNTLVISPPGSGKTTMLRDITRQLSDEGIRVCVVDERREIAAMHSGRTDFDLGSSAVVFSGAPKTAGMLMMLRAMAPQVIITDEIGTVEDAAAVSRIINSGTKIITSIHGNGVKQIQHRKEIAAILPYFETYITMADREVKEIITI